MTDLCPSTSSYVPRCPICDYALAALVFVPAESKGEFTVDVACPECGFVVPAGGRIIEGSVNGKALAPIKGPDIFVGILNLLVAGAGSVALLGWRLFPFPMPVAYCAVVIGVNGGVGFMFLYRVWRRIQQVRLPSRTGRLVHGIRWVISVAGIERIDRRNFLRPPKRTWIPAARVYRITGASVAMGARNRPNRESHGSAARLTAWFMQADARGCAVDIESTSVVVLHGAVDREGSGTDPAVLASQLERCLGLHARHGRGIPQLPFADSGARLRFLGTLGTICFGIAFLAFQAIALRDIATASNPGQFLIEVLVLTQGSALVAVALIYFGTLAVIRRVRRRWVRDHIVAA